MHVYTCTAMKMHVPVNRVEACSLPREMQHFNEVMYFKNAALFLTSPPPPPCSSACISDRCSNTKGSATQVPPQYKGFYGRKSVHC